MRYLFYFVHPSKFYVFRNSINALKSKGHHVDVIVISKDMLAELVEKEGWEYTNLFPKGRKMKGVSAYISSGINFFITIWRLWKYTRNKNYDLFITDDLLVFIGKLRKIPTFTFIDSDLKAIKQFSIILKMTDFVIAPDITNLEKYNAKKIAYKGYKELAYLHPNYFKPDIDIVKTFNPTLLPYFILRLVNFGAYHDVGMGGLSNENIKKLIGLLEKHGKVFITSERQLLNEFEKYRLTINPLHIAHALYYAEIFIGDSQTMTSEAAVLGTPAFRCNDFVGLLSVMEEKEKRYGLSFNYLPKQFNEMYAKIAELLSIPNFKKKFEDKKNKMLEEKIDLSAFLLELFESFPITINHYRDKYLKR